MHLWQHRKETNIIQITEKNVFEVGSYFINFAFEPISIILLSDVPRSDSPKAIIASSIPCRQLAGLVLDIHVVQHFSASHSPFAFTLCSMSAMTTDR